MNSGYSNTGVRNSATNMGPLSYVLGSGIVPQVLFGFLLVVGLYVLMLSAEIIYKNISQIVATRVDLMPITYVSNHQYQFKQSPFENPPYNPATKKATSTHLPSSDNERTGSEFSYSFWLWIEPSSFGDTEGLLHVFHKGYSSMYPLMSPGVFLKNNVNTLRVYMNSSTTWNNYVDVENVPISKWVHVIVMARNNAGEIYINGNLSKKLNMDNGVIYQNFQDLYVFSTRKVASNPTTTPSLLGVPFTVNGTYTGQMSRLVYFNYALSYTEIQTLVNEGPSSIIESNPAQTPPYLEDKWWVTAYNAGQ